MSFLDRQRRERLEAVAFGLDQVHERVSASQHSNQRKQGGDEEDREKRRHEDDLRIHSHRPGSPEAKHEREDEPQPCLPVEDALAAAPDGVPDAGLFRVPRVMGG